MALPAFLRFLAPLLGVAAGDDVHASGHVRIEKWKAGALVELVYDGKNFIVDQGLTATRDLLMGQSGGGIAGAICRMAIGDGGTPAGQLFSPKQPDASWPGRTGLYHEVIRQDVSVFSKPTPTAMRFVGSFNSADVDPTSFSLADRVINEAALIVGSGILTVGGGKKQVNKTPPDSSAADEKVMSVRTFKSTSFDPIDNVVLTVTWTLNVIR